MNFLGFCIWITNNCPVSRRRNLWSFKSTVRLHTKQGADDLSLGVKTVQKNVKFCFHWDLLLVICHFWGRSTWCYTKWSEEKGIWQIYELFKCMFLKVRLYRYDEGALLKGWSCYRSSVYELFLQTCNL